MRGLLAWLWRHRARVAAGLLCLLAVDAVQTLIPLLVRSAIDDLVAGRSDRLAWQAGGMLAIGAAMIGLRYLWRFFIIGASRRIRRDLRLELHAAFLALDAGFRHGRSTGEQMALATNDLDAVGQACGFGLMAFADAVFMVLLSLGAMLALDPRLALLAALPLPFIALYQWWAGSTIHRRFEAVQEGFARLTEQVREALAGIRTVKAHAREPGLERSLEAGNQANLRANLRLVRLWTLFEPTIALCAGIPVLVVLWVGGRAAIAGGISLGDFVAFIAFLGMLTWPMMAIGWSVNLVSRGTASMARIAAVLGTAPAIAPPARPRPLPATAGIGLHGVHVRHPGAASDALHGIEVELPAGAVLGVVGPTASGKSTLANLLVRLADPTQGRVLLGGIDLRELDPRQLRRAVALVPQEPFAFALSVRENIAFARPDAGDAEVEAAAAMAGLHAEIRAMPQGYATMLGERGVTLSGGQRQRLAIARALLADPRVLVLDDCLSAVDAATEAAVLANLRSARAGRTTVIISHRLRTVADADLVLVLDHGRVVERGRHPGLAAGGGLYARLWTLQQAEQAVEERT